MSLDAGPDGMHAGWIEADRQQLFVCYHPPRPGAPRRDRAILLCDPFGSDRMTLHLAYRALALALSRAGFAVLRVDYVGTGDSSGGPREASVESWIGALDRAAEFLRQASGAHRLGLFGALLGATLAMELSSRRDDVDSLMLLAPHATGRAFLREVQVFSATTQANPSGRKPPDHREGDLEHMGFLLAPALVSSLRGWRPEPGASRVRRAAIFQRSQRASVKRLQEPLEAAGVEVTVVSALSDIEQLFNRHLERHHDVIDRMAQWWAADASDGADPAAEASGPGPTPGELDAVGLQVGVELDGDDGEALHEEFVRFGDGGRLVAIVTRPSEWRTGHAVLLVNGGANHRPGINRNYTEWARAWASRGLLVMRMDISGLGDSPPSAGQQAGLLYQDDARQDVHAAVAVLRERFGARRVFSGGVCAGGYQAFQAALERGDIDGLFMLNPLRFEPDYQEGGRRPELDHQPLSHYLRALSRTASWKRLVRGEVPVLEVTQSIGSRIARRAGRVVRHVLLGDEAGAPVTWLVSRFDALARRDCHVMVIFNAAEPICGRFDEEVAPYRERLRNLRVELLEDTDHTLTPLWSQRRVGELLDDWLRSRLTAAPARPGGGTSSASIPHGVG